MPSTGWAVVNALTVSLPLFAVAIAGDLAPSAEAGATAWDCKCWLAELLAFDAFENPGGRSSDVGVLVDDNLEAGVMAGC